MKPPVLGMFSDPGPEGGRAARKLPERKPTQPSKPVSVSLQHSLEKGQHSLHLFFNRSVGRLDQVGVAGLGER